jgi:hypothetical protein
MEPVMIEHHRDHKFVAKDREQKRPRCAVCERGKGNIAHFGTPKSLNVFASSRNEFTYLRAKQMWEERIVELLRDAQLEPAGRFLVEGEMCFPDKIRRDQGNYRFIIEKAMGDALTSEGYLEDDDWSRYEFGNLTYRYEKGVSCTRLVLFPAERAEFVEPPAVKSVPSVQDETLFTPA